MRVPTSALMVDALRRFDVDAAVELGAGTVDPLIRRLTDAARLLGGSPHLAAPTDRADAFHHLLVTLHAAIDHSILQTDPTEPMFSPVLPTHRVDWGARNPDGVYRKAFVADDRSYRIHGRLGNAAYLTFDFVGAADDSEAGDGVTAEELEVGPDGSFELLLGGPERPARWHPMRPGVVAVTTREFFGDWAAAQRSVLRIDCIDDDVLGRTELPPRPEHDAARVAAEFAVLADWYLEGGFRFWLEEWHSAEAAPTTRNRFMDFYRVATKRPTVSRGCWELSDDEALLVELPDPGAAYWGIQCASILAHTLDFASRLTTINGTQARVDDDGVVRIVVAHRDPGVHNWLDTTGLRHGELILRVHGADRLEVPATTVLRWDQLPTSGRITPEERRAQIRARRDGVAHLLCD